MPCPLGFQRTTERKARGVGNQTVQKACGDDSPRALPGQSGIEAVARALAG
jgi:hypothetical protein